MVHEQTELTVYLNGTWIVSCLDYLPDVLPKEFSLSGGSMGCQLSGEVIVDNQVALEEDRVFTMSINSTNPQSARIVFHYPQLQVIIRDNDSEWVGEHLGVWSRVSS